MRNGIVVIGNIFVDIKGYPLGTFIPTGRNAGRVEQVHGGVCRNVAENIANLELRPTFISLTDSSGTGTDAVEKLRRHKVNVDYIRTTPDGLGTWLAIFDNTGDVAASISKRPDNMPIADILTEKGDEIFENADSVVLEFDLPPEIVKQIFALAEKHHKPVFAVISNMQIAVERRDLLKRIGCLVCNQQEAGVLFLQDYSDKTPEELTAILPERTKAAQISRMVVTLGSKGAVYVDNMTGESGWLPSYPVQVVDTTGAGDAFFSGVAVGLTYGKALREACIIGTRLAVSVIVTSENVCPRFLPSEFGLDVQPE